jgi:hypothetical protein
MSPRTRAAHNFYKGMILDDIEAKMAAAEAAAASPSGPEQESTPTDASTTSYASTPASTASASASASVSASATEKAHRAVHDEVVVIDGPTSTQDAVSASPNHFL